MALCDKKELSKLEQKRRVRVRKRIKAKEAELKMPSNEERDSMISAFEATSRTEQMKREAELVANLRGAPRVKQLKMDQLWSKK